MPTEYTAEQLRAMLTAGEAVARLIKSDEAWYASVVTRRGIRHEWSLGIDPVDDGGTYGEFVIEWVELGQGSRPELHPRLKVFGDGAQALLTIPGVIEAIELDEPEAVYERLLSLGYVDKTERTNPDEAAQVEWATTEIRGALKSIGSNGPTRAIHLTSAVVRLLPEDVHDDLAELIRIGRRNGVTVTIDLGPRQEV